jgi:hypothetical protein
MYINAVLVDRFSELTVRDTHPRCKVQGEVELFLLLASTQMWKENFHAQLWMVCPENCRQ